MKYSTYHGVSNFSYFGRSFPWHYLKKSKYVNKNLLINDDF